MGHDYPTLAEMVEKNMIVVDYSDDDIAIIDNVNDITEIGPTRIHNNFIAIVEHGKAQMKINGQTVTIGERQMLLCPTNTSLTDFMFSPGLQFHAVLLTDRIISAFLRDKKSVWTDTLYIHKTNVITIEQRSIEFLASIFQALSILVGDKEGNHPYRTDSIRGLVYSSIFGLCDILARNMPKEGNAYMPLGDSVFRQFLQLLNENKVNGNRVEDYAPLLCVSPKYLSSICKKASGKTAKRWIKEHIMEEIMYNLKETDLTIKQVADRTGFANDSFFCKYVKQNFGMTPMQLRLK